MRALNILVIDDDPAICMALSLLLKRQGHNPTCAVTAAEAHAAMAAGDYDVALVDKRFPGKGLLLAKELSGRADLAGRVLIITGDAPDDNEEDFPIVRKPFDYDALIARIEALSASS